MKVSRMSTPALRKRNSSSRTSIPGRVTLPTSSLSTSRNCPNDLVLLPNYSRRSSSSSSHKKTTLSSKITSLAMLPSCLPFDTWGAGPSFISLLATMTLWQPTYSCVSELMGTLRLRKCDGLLFMRRLRAIKAIWWNF